MEIVDTLIVLAIPGAMAAGLVDPLFWQLGGCTRHRRGCCLSGESLAHLPRQGPRPGPRGARRGGAMTSAQDRDPQEHRGRHVCQRPSARTGSCYRQAMSSVGHICLVCQSGFDPDDEVLRATRTSTETVGGQEISPEETRYAHIEEEQEVVALGGWTVVDRGPLHDFPP